MGGGGEGVYGEEMGRHAWCSFATKVSPNLVVPSNPPTAPPLERTDLLHHHSPELAEHGRDFLHRFRCKHQTRARIRGSDTRSTYSIGITPLTCPHCTPSSQPTTAMSENIAQKLNSPSSTISLCRLLYKLELVASMLTCASVISSSSNYATAQIVISTARAIVVSTARALP